MPAFNFQSGFTPKILAGEKITTIRRSRLRKTRPGEIISLYTGMRTRQCQLIARSICVSLEMIELNLAARWAFLNGRRMNPLDVEMLAREDGFLNAASMFDWFEAKYPIHHDNCSFCGELIEWAYPFRLTEGSAGK